MLLHLPRGTLSAPGAPRGQDPAENSSPLDTRGVNLKKKIVFNLRLDLLDTRALARYDHFSALPPPSVTDLASRRVRDCINECRIKLVSSF